MSTNRKDGWFDAGEQVEGSGDKPERVSIAGNVLLRKLTGLRAEHDAAAAIFDALSKDTPIWIGVGNSTVSIKPGEAGWHRVKEVGMEATKLRKQSLERQIIEATIGKVST